MLKKDMRDIKATQIEILEMENEPDKYFQQIRHLQNNELDNTAIEITQKKTHKNIFLRKPVY